MKLCSNGHDEVVYESSSCPSCDLQSKILELERQVEELEDEVGNLVDQIQDLPESDI